MLPYKKSENNKLFQTRNDFKIEQNHLFESRIIPGRMYSTNQIDSETHLFIVPWQQIRKENILE